MMNIHSASGKLLKIIANMFGRMGFMRLLGFRWRWRWMAWRETKSWCTRSQRKDSKSILVIYKLCPHKMLHFHRVNSLPLILGQINRMLELGWKGVWSPINLAHAWSLTLEFLPFQKRIKFGAFQSLTKRCGEARSASVTWRWCWCWCWYVGNQSPHLPGSVLLIKQ